MPQILSLEFDKGNPDHAILFDQIMYIIGQHPSYHQYQISDESILTLPGLIINLERHQAICNNTAIALTNKEFHLLCVLVKNKNEILSHTRLYYLVWEGRPADNSHNVIASQVYNLKSKLLKAYGARLPFEIKSYREIGYCLKILKDADIK